MHDLSRRGNGFIAGAGYLFQGFSLLGRRGIKRYVVIPLLLNIILFAALLVVNYHEIHILVAYVNKHLPWWLHWLDWLIYPLLLSVVLIIISYSFSMFANLIAAPFNGFLSEKVEKIIIGNTPDSASAAFSMADAPRVVLRQLRFIGYYLPRALLMLLLFFIPFIHIFFVVLWFIFNAWMMVLQYADYPMDNHRVPFHDMRRVLAENRALSLGFGAAVMACTIIPFINFPSNSGGCNWCDYYGGGLSFT